MQRRVVVTGMGIVSCLGNSQQDVVESLKTGRSGIVPVPEYAEMRLRSQVAGVPRIDLEALIERKTKRFMGDAAGYAYVAMGDAIVDAGLSADQLSDPRTGVIAGSGGGSVANQIQAGDLLRSRGVRHVGPYMVSRTMASTVAAALATAYKIKGTSYSIASACATAAHCIGAGMDLIRGGRQDVMFVGGAEELHWGLTCMFDAMGALSTHYNATPETASRAFDATRDGFVIAGGAGILVLEDAEHALRRGATIHAELVGYGATSDGSDMVAPSGEGAERCMRMAMEMAGNSPIDYLNAHATSTPAGDATELGAIRKTFARNVPRISSTKSLSGHSLGAAGAHEAIYSILMMKHDFIAASANIETLCDEAAGLPIVRKTEAGVLERVMSNSFGFGGTNATLIFERWTA